MAVATLREMAKPNAGREAIGIRNDRAARGGMGQRASKGQPGTWDRGYCAVYDADLASYFEHGKLMVGLKTRISDRSVLHLIEMWLKAPVVDKDDAGRPRWSRPKQGTPQGGVLSPLLSNAFLH